MLFTVLFVLELQPQSPIATKLKSGIVCVGSDREVVMVWSEAPKTGDKAIPLAIMTVNSNTKSSSVCNARA